MLQTCPLIAAPTLTALPFCELTPVLGFKIKNASEVTALGYIETAGLAV